MVVFQDQTKKKKPVKKMVGKFEMCLKMHVQGDLKIYTW